MNEKERETSGLNLSASKHSNLNEWREQEKGMKDRRGERENDRNSRDRYTRISQSLTQANKQANILSRAAHSLTQLTLLLTHSHARFTIKQTANHLINVVRVTPVIHVHMSPNSLTRPPPLPPSPVLTRKPYPPASTNLISSEMILTNHSSAN